MRRRLSLGLNEKLKLPSSVWHGVCVPFSRLSALMVTQAKKLGSQQHVLGNRISSCSQKTQWAYDKRTPRYSKII